MRFDNIFCTAAVSLVLTLCAVPGVSTAQSLEELDHLIFEPVPLPPDKSEDVSAPAPGSREGRGDGDEGSDLNTFNTGTDTPAGGTGSIDDYQDAIIEAESEGPYSAELKEDLLSLGNLYQERGDHERALEIFERADHIIRVNNGLYSMEQVPAVKNMIESLVARGEIQEAENKHQYLVYLHEQHYGNKDPRVVSALQNLAEWNMERFHRGVRFEAESTFSITFNNNRYSSEGDVRRRAFRELYQAQNAYLKAIRNLVENEQYQDQRLPGLERSLIETYFLQAHRRSILENPDNYLNRPRRYTGSLIRHRIGRGYSPTYHFGKDAYTRILAYMLNTPGTSLKEYVETKLELGDWYMLYGRRILAHRKYKEAFEAMEKLNVNQRSLGEVLTPTIPVTLPTFTATPHTREMHGVPQDTELSYKGYVDISFSLSKYGKARHIEILGSSDGTARSVERRLKSLVRMTQFRPRLDTQGEPIDEDPFSLRYYYTW